MSSPSFERAKVAGSELINSIGEAADKLLESDTPSRFAETFIFATKGYKNNLEGSLYWLRFDKERTNHSRTLQRRNRYRFNQLLLIMRTSYSAIFRDCNNIQQLG